MYKRMQIVKHKIKQKKVKSPNKHKYNVFIYSFKQNTTARVEM